MLSVTHGPASLCWEGRTLNTHSHSYSSPGNLVPSVLFPLSFCLLAFKFLILSEQISDKSKKSDDESEDEDDPAKLQKKRDWDEWKDG